VDASESAVLLDVCDALPPGWKLDLRGFTMSDTTQQQLLYTLSQSPGDSSRSIQLGWLHRQAFDALTIAERGKLRVKFGKWAGNPAPEKLPSTWENVGPTVELDVPLMNKPVDPREAAEKTFKTIIGKILPLHRHIKTAAPLSHTELIGFLHAMYPDMPSGVGDEVYADFFTPLAHHFTKSDEIRLKHSLESVISDVTAFNTACTRMRARIIALIEHINKNTPEDKMNLETRRERLLRYFMSHVRVCCQEKLGCELPRDADTESQAATCMALMEPVTALSFTRLAFEALANIVADAGLIQQLLMSMKLKFDNFAREVFSSRAEDLYRLCSAKRDAIAKAKSVAADDVIAAGVDVVMAADAPFNAEGVVTQSIPFSEGEVITSFVKPKTMAADNESLREMFERDAVLRSAVAGRQFGFLVQHRKSKEFAYIVDTSPPSEGSWHCLGHAPSEEEATASVNMAFNNGIVNIEFRARRPLDPGVAITYFVEAVNEVLGADGLPDTPRIRESVEEVQ
jgi:hypothetical protein